MIRLICQQKEVCISCASAVFWVASMREIAVRRFVMADCRVYNKGMKSTLVLSLGFAIAVLTQSACAAEPRAGESPADRLPPYITQLTAFGERPDWSPDGKRILFLSKTYGDAMEIDLATHSIHNLTAHFPHVGFTRAFYLPNGDVLLSGPDSFDPKKPAEARIHCFLSVLDKSCTKPPVPLGVRCNEGPAVSRHKMHIAWTEWLDQPTSDVSPKGSQINEADIVYEAGTPKLANQRPVLSSSDLPFDCTMETQNFRPPAERELTFSAYTKQGKAADVCGVDLVSKKVTKYTDTPDEYDEPEGIYPDGQHTLVECDRQNHLGNGHIDLWKLALDGGGDYQRLTHFSDYPDYKASNPVVSDDGRFFAFQMGHAGEAAGVGHGIFVYDIEKAAAN
jgi:WD40-like Beta Propeller Repeat